MQLKFEKWHGCRNDFVIVWLTDSGGQVVTDSIRRQVEKLCSKSGDGIGADGIIVLLIANERQLLPREMIVINRDGSLATNCGNGLRCAALSVLKRYRESAARDPLEFVDMSLAGVPYSCRFVGVGGKSWPRVAVEMGQPRVDGNLEWDMVAKEVVRQCLDQTKSKDVESFHCVEIGNRHLVFFLSASGEEEVIKTLGPTLQKTPHWDGINVSVATLRAAKADDRIQIPGIIDRAPEEVLSVSTWERGVGLTQACGSAACAVAASVYAASQVPYGEWIAVAMPGGRLYLRQESQTEPILLLGTAEFVFAGTVEI